MNTNWNIDRKAKTARLELEFVIPRAVICRRFAIVFVIGRIFEHQSGIHDLGQLRKSKFIN